LFSHPPDAHKSRQPATLCPLCHLTFR